MFSLDLLKKKKELEVEVKTLKASIKSLEESKRDAIEAIEEAKRKELKTKKKEIEDLKDKYEDEIKCLKGQKSDIELRNKMELKEIEHMVRLKKEKDEVELEKQKAIIANSYKDKEMELQKTYFEKHMTLIKEAQDKLQVIHEKILDRFNIDVVMGNQPKKDN